MMEFFKKYGQSISFLAGILLAVFTALFNPFSLDATANKTVAVAVLMITWWITEAMPMPVVALIPLVLLPLFGIASIEETSKAYSNPVIFLFMGGFMIGLAIEKWNLHKRIALNIVKKTGTGGNKIILGFILSTGDQCGRDTPDANLFALVETARRYGRYDSAGRLPELPKES